MKKEYLSILEEIKKNGGKDNLGELNDKVLIIDGLNTFIRCFSAIPTTNDDGEHIGGLSGFLKSIGYVVSMVRPTRAIVVFDGKGGSTRRRKLYPEYKQGRKMSERLNRADGLFNEKNDERFSMMKQLRRVVEYLEYLPVLTYSVDGIEADDTIGYLTKQCLKESEVIIMSTDKDFLQLVSDRVSVYSPTKKKFYKPPQVLEEYGVSSKNLLYYRIIEGDKSDNIKGVRGIGGKTIQKWEVLSKDKMISMDELISLDKRLSDSSNTLDINYKLMQLHDVNISGTTKINILDRLDEPPTELKKVKFQKLFLEDKLYGAIPNIDSWLNSTWSMINHIVKNTNGKKENL
tara:strand:- start:1782 stop:2819 length:1038 start_codon:yes stop_codon:yes gene_type:complete